MEKRILRQFIMLSKYFVFGFVLQLFFTAVILANTSKAQRASLSEIDVSLQVEDLPLKQVFETLEKQSHLKFSYNESFQKVTEEKMSIDIPDGKMTDVLKEISGHTNLKFLRINDNIHVVRKKENEKSLDEIISDKAIIDISGTVTEVNGNPIPGVTVRIKGGTRGTVTDIEGNYQLKVEQGDVLTYSFVGFVYQEVTVANQSKIDIVLKEDLQALEEVVVVGYGTMKKSDLTGSVVSLDADNLVNIPATNALETLQGRVSGLDITRSSGQAGAGLNFTVRGNRSLNASNAPLILVDGIQYGSYIDINPNDIKSVEVLKDASSTAIYGSRGANGVIIISTKEGAKGKTKVELNNYYGVNALTDYRKFADNEQYVEMTREAFEAAGQWSGPEDDETIFGANYANIQKGINTDWPSMMLHNGKIQSHHLAISGGNEKSSFRLSSEYFKETGLVKNDELKRFVQRINFDHKILDNLKVGAALNFNVSDQDTRNTSFWNLIKLLPTGQPYNEDGTLKELPFPGNLTLNPLFDEHKENYSNNTKSNRVFLVGNVDWKIIDNLNLRSNIGLDIQNRQQGVFEGSKSTWSTNNNGFSKSSLSDTYNRNLTWENVLNYRMNWGDHSLDMMVGNSLLTYRTTSLSGEGRNQAFESSLFYNLNTNTDNIRTFSNLTESQLASFFGRVNYKFLEKYLLTASLRADGSSVLADDKKWAYFPSVALAWRLKEESFLQNATWLSDLKTRVSYGVSGNSAIAPYQTQGGVSKLNFAFNENPAFGYIPTMIPNKDLGWETTATKNLGLDFGFLDDRIYGSVDLYQTETSDLLMQSILPALTGYSSVIANIGKTETKGIDLQLTTRNVNIRDFRWSTSLNFSSVKEKIVELSAGGDDVSNAWFVGEPLNVFYDYEKVGIWQSDEADDAESFDKKPGEIKVKDQNDDGKISAADDRVILGQASPKWTAGMTNNFSYKNFTMSVLVYARVGQMIDSEFRKMYYTGGIHNTPYVDYWTPENPTNDYPRPVLGNDQYISTLGYIDGSFLKIKEIRLAYNLPKVATDFLHTDRISVYTTAKNFFTFSELKDYDPERGGSATFPLTKQLVFGLNIQF